ncbi:kinesin light chain [Trichonephila clavipes]|nr:kinesin light chain [Trichonephila clavipes]
MSVWRYASKSNLLLKEFSKLTAEIISQLTKDIRYNEACLFGSRAFELLKAILGPDYPDTLTVQNNVAEALNEQGHDHPDTLRTGHNMALVFDNQGKYDAALNAYTEVLNKRKAILGIDHPDTLRTQHNMAVILSRQGKYDAALNAYTEVLNKREVVLGHDHPDTLRTRYNIALVLEKRGNYSEALKILREVLNIQKAKLGSDHPSTLLTSRNIEEISTKQASGCSIQFHQKQEKTYFHLSEFISNNLQNAPIEPVRQGLYLPSFEERQVEFVVTSNHVIAVYRTSDSYAYFDSNTAFVSALKSIDAIMKVVEKAIEFAGYEVGEKGFLVEHFDVAKANKLLSDEDEQIFTKQIKTERQLLAEQDKFVSQSKIGVWSH